MLHIKENVINISNIVVFSIIQNIFAQKKTTFEQSPLMLSTLKNQLFSRFSQAILFDTHGCVLDSDQQLFEIEKGSSVLTLHPIFGSSSIHWYKKDKRFYYENIKIHLNNQTHHTTLVLNTGVGKNRANVIAIFFEMNINSRSATAKETGPGLYPFERFYEVLCNEVRNPLGIITTFSESLEKQPLEMAQKDLVMGILSAAQYAHSVLNTVQKSSTLLLGKVRLDKRVFELPLLLKTISRIFKLKANLKGLKFITSIDQSLPKTVYADATLIKQIIIHLIDNAIKFTAKGTVSFFVNLQTSSASTCTVLFTVEDSGIGIPAEKTKKVTQPFVQLNSTKFEGSGLGLSIVERGLALMDSNLVLEKRRQKGTKASFSLRLLLPTTSQKLEEKPSTFDEKKLLLHPIIRMLIVEDVSYNQDSLIKSLYKFPNIQMDMVSEAEQVESLVHKNTYDIILVNLDLKSDAKTLLKRLKSLRDYPKRGWKTMITAGHKMDPFIRQKKNRAYDCLLLRPYLQKDLYRAIGKMMASLSKSELVRKP